MIELWSENDNNIVKLNAFLVILKLAKMMNMLDLDIILKKCYVSLVKNIKFINYRNYE